MVTIKTMILRDKLKANVYTLEMSKSYGDITTNIQMMIFFSKSTF